MEGQQAASITVSAPSFGALKALAEMLSFSVQSRIVAAEARNKRVAVLFSPS